MNPNHHPKWIQNGTQNGSKTAPKMDPKRHPKWIQKGVKMYQNTSPICIEIATKTGFEIDAIMTP
jgi:hypothetical protein